MSQHSTSHDATSNPTSKISVPSEKRRGSYAFPITDEASNAPETEQQPPSSKNIIEDAIPLAIVRKRTRSSGRKGNPPSTSTTSPILINDDETEEEDLDDQQPLDENGMSDDVRSESPKKTTSKRKTKSTNSLSDIVEVDDDNAADVGSKEKGAHSSPESGNNNEGESVEKEPKPDELDPPKKKLKGKNPVDKTAGYLSLKDPVSLSGKWDPIRVMQQIENSSLSSDIKTVCDRLICKEAIHTSRVYPSSWLSSDKAFSAFLEAIKAQGWEKLIQMEEPVFASEVIQFYATVHVTASLKTLTAKINGKSLSLSQTQLAKILSLPHQGYDLTPAGKVWPLLAYAFPSDIAKTVHPSNPKSEPISPNKLPAFPKLLYNLLCRTIYPSNDRVKASAAQQYLIYHLMTHRKINLPSLMFKRFAMIEAKLNDPNYTTPIRLPYGMWLSVILRSKGMLVKESVGSQGMFDHMSVENLGKMMLKTRKGELSSITKKGKVAEEGSSSKVGNLAGVVDNSEILDALANLKDDVAGKADKADVACLSSLKADVEIIKTTLDLLKGEVAILSSLLQATPYDEDNGDASSDDTDDDLDGIQDSNQ